MLRYSRYVHAARSNSSFFGLMTLFDSEATGIAHSPDGSVAVFAEKKAAIFRDRIPTGRPKRFPSRVTKACYKSSYSRALCRE